MWISLLIAGVLLIGMLAGLYLLQRYLKGEPLATTPVEAYAVFVRSGLDFLVLGNCLVSKQTAEGEVASADLEHAA